MSQIAGDITSLISSLDVICGHLHTEFLANLRLKCEREEWF